MGILSPEDTIEGIENKCPQCGYKIQYRFKKGSELILEFVEKLSEMKNELGTNYFDPYIEEYEKMLK